MDQTTDKTEDELYFGIGFNFGSFNRQIDAESSILRMEDISSEIKDHFG